MSHPTRRTRGTAAVEATVVLPLIVLMAIGFIEVGWWIDRAQLLHNAACQGARAAVRLENSNAEVNAAVLNTLNDSISVPTNSVTVRISKLNSSGSEDYQVMSLDENEQGHPIRVSVTVSGSALRPLSNMLGLASRSLTSSAVMRRQE